MGEYSYIITNAGLAKIAAHQADPTSNPAVNITHIAVGDSNGAYYTPLATQTQLVHETKRVNITNRGVDTDNAAKMFFISRIPAADFGYAIREAGLFDSAGTLIAVRKYPLVDKTTEGNMIEVYMKEELVVANTASFDLTIDENLITATQQWAITQINEAIADHNHDDRYYTEVEVDELINGIFPEYVKPLAIISGNTDGLTGLPNIVHKVSNTEVEFLVGGIYKPLKLSGKDGKKYVVSSIPNITVPAGAGICKYVLMKENFTKQADGTYHAIATPIMTGYTYYSNNNIIPVMTSNNSGGFIATGPAQNYGGENYYPFDGNDSTSLNSYELASDGSMVILEFDNPKNIWAYTVRHLDNYAVGWAIDLYYGGVWHEVDAHSNTYITDLTQFVLSSPVSNVTKLRFRPTGFRPGGSFFLATLGLCEFINYSGGNVTNGYTFPESQDVSILPAMTSNNSDGWTITSSSNPAPLSENPAWHSADGNSATYTSFQVPVGSVNVVAVPIEAKPFIKCAKNSGSFDLKRVGITPYNAPNSPMGLKIYDQSDNLLLTWVATELDWVNGMTRYFDLSSVAAGLTAVKLEFTHSYSNSSFVFVGAISLYAAASSQSGDLHILINEAMPECYKMIDGNWNNDNKEFWTIGETYRAIDGGTLGTPRSYAFNREYISEVFAITATQHYEKSHNLGIDPKHIEFSVKLQDNAGNWRDILSSFYAVCEVNYVKQNTIQLATNNDLHSMEKAIITVKGAW
jgi:hypothetical protein